MDAAFKRIWKSRKIESDRWEFRLAPVEPFPPLIPTFSNRDAKTALRGSWWPFFRGLFGTYSGEMDFEVVLSEMKCAATVLKGSIWKTSLGRNGTAESALGDGATSGTYLGTGTENESVQTS